MRRLLLAFLMVVGCIFYSNSQTCPTESLTLSTQSDINNFATTYPGCTNLPYSLSIIEGAGETIDNLNGLAQLQTIQGNLSIQNNATLNNLSGLINLTAVTGDFVVSLNDGLTDVSGFDNLNTIGGHFTFLWNSALVDVSGLGGLNTVGNYIQVFDNDALEDISGLNALTTLTSYFLIDGNDKLESISGFTLLPSTGGYLSIVNNSSLLNISGLSTLTAIGGFLKIENNDALSGINPLSNVLSLSGFLSVKNNANLKRLDGLQNIDPLSITDLDILDNSKLLACEVASICSYLDNGGTHTIETNFCGCNTFAEINTLCTNTCLDGGIVITTQAQIDNFATNYPSCDRINGDVVIAEDVAGTITNLDGLSQVKSIKGSLHIQDNTMLNNLNGLSQLILVDGTLSLSNNAILPNVNGLSQMKAIFGNIQITQNALLDNVIGLNGVLQIEGSVEVDNNAVLNSISGLKNIAASSLTGFTISNNTALGECAIFSLCDYLEMPGSSVTITNNAVDCNSVATVNTACAALPVELISFTGQKADQGVELNWQTVSELNNAGFEIQKSENALDWEIIDWMPGRGTTEELNTYSFLDTKPYVGHNYYRLKQIDFDGQFAFSNIVNVKGELNDLAIQIVPNPSIGDFTVTVANPQNSKMKITLFDSRGEVFWTSRLIKDEAVWRKDFYINQDGLYFLTVQLGREIFSEKVVVSKQ